MNASQTTQLAVIRDLRLDRRKNSLMPVFFMNPNDQQVFRNVNN